MARTKSATWVVCRASAQWLDWPDPLPFRAARHRAHLSGFEPLGI